MMGNRRVQSNKICIKWMDQDYMFQRDFVWWRIHNCMWRIMAEPLCNNVAVTTLVLLFKNLGLCMEVTKLHELVNNDGLKARMEKICDIKDMNQGTLIFQPPLTNIDILLSVITQNLVFHLHYILIVSTTYFFWIDKKSVEKK